MATLVRLLVQICLLMGVGILLKKLRILGEDSSEVLSNLIIYLVLPCNILFSFHISTDGQLLAAIGLVFLCSLTSQVIFAAANCFLYHRFSPQEKASAKYATICPNCAFMGTPIAEAMYGGAGILLSAVYQIPQRIAMWSVGVSYYCGSGNWKITLRKVATHPCIIAVVGGLLLMVMPLSLPAPLNGAIQSVGARCTPLSMILTGTILADVPLREALRPKSLCFCLLRLLVLPGALFAAYTLLGVPALVRGITVIMAAMPGGTVSAILAAKYRCDERFAAQNVALSTLLTCVTIPPWSYLLTL